MNVTLPLAWGINASDTIPSSEVPTPLMFLSPHDAHIIQVATYLHLASTGILIWDFLNNLRNDFRLLFQYKLGVPTLLYFVMRLSLIAYSLGRAVLLTTPIRHCHALSQSLNICLVICVGSTASFFYLRMVAIYSRNRYVVVVFGVTWLTIIALAVLFTKTFDSEHIAQTEYCKEVITGNFLVPILSFMLANDFLVYLAIAYRIYRIFSDYEFEADLRRRLVILLFGASLPVGSKVVLLESQLSCLFYAHREPSHERIILVSKFFLVLGLAIEQNTIYIFIICHFVLKIVLTSAVYRELRGLSDNSIKPAATDFRTANLTSAVFRHGTTQRDLEQERKTRQLDETSSIAGSVARAGVHDTTRFPTYGGSETVNLDVFSETSTPRSYQASFTEMRADKGAIGPGV